MQYKALSKMLKGIKKNTLGEVVTDFGPLTRRRESF